MDHAAHIDGHGQQHASQHHPNASNHVTQDAAAITPTDSLKALRLHHFFAKMYTHEHIDDLCYGLGGTKPFSPFILQSAIEGHDAFAWSRTLGCASGGAAEEDAKRRDAMHSIIDSFLTEHIEYLRYAKTWLCKIDGSTFATKELAVRYLHDYYTPKVEGVLTDIVNDTDNELDHMGFFFTKMFYSDLIYSPITTTPRDTAPDFPSILAPEVKPTAEIKQRNHSSEAASIKRRQQEEKQTFVFADEELTSIERKIFGSRLRTHTHSLVPPASGAAVAPPTSPTRPKDQAQSQAKDAAATVPAAEKVQPPPPAEPKGKPAPKESKAAAKGASAPAANGKKRDKEAEKLEKEAEAADAAAAAILLQQQQEKEKEKEKERLKKEKEKEREREKQQQAEKERKEREDKAKKERERERARAAELAEYVRKNKKQLEDEFVAELLAEVIEDLLPKLAARSLQEARKDQEKADKEEHEAQQQAEAAALRDKRAADKKLTRELRKIEIDRAAEEVLDEVTFEEVLALALEVYSEAQQARAQAAILHPIVPPKGIRTSGVSPLSPVSLTAPAVVAVAPAATSALAAAPASVVPHPHPAHVAKGAQPLLLKPAAVSHVPAVAAQPQTTPILAGRAAVVPFSGPRGFPAATAPAVVPPNVSLRPPFGSDLTPGPLSSVSASSEDDFEFSTADLKAQLLEADDEEEEEEEHAPPRTESASAGWFAGPSTSSPRKPSTPPPAADSLPLLKTVPEDYGLNPALCVACYGCGNLNKSDIMAFFKGCMISVGDPPEFASKIHFLRGPDSGACFVQFETVADWERALSRDNQMLHEKHRLRVVRAVGLHTTPTGQSFRLKVQARNIDPSIVPNNADKQPVIAPASHQQPQKLATLAHDAMIAPQNPIERTPSQDTSGFAHFGQLSMPPMLKPPTSQHSLSSLLNTAQDDIVTPAPKPNRSAFGTSAIGPSMMPNPSAMMTPPSLAAAHLLDSLDEPDDVLNDETFSSSPVSLDPKLGAFDGGKFTASGPAPAAAASFGGARAAPVLRTSQGHAGASAMGFGGRGPVAAPPPGLAASSGGFGAPPGLVSSGGAVPLPPGLYRATSPHTTTVPYGQPTNAVAAPGSARGATHSKQSSDPAEAAFMDRFM